MFCSCLVLLRLWFVLVETCSDGVVYVVFVEWLLLKLCCEERCVGYCMSCMVLVSSPVFLLSPRGVRWVYMMCLCSCLCWVLVLGMLVSICVG